MKKLMIAMAALAATAQALAMPTRAELSKAQPLVNELMAPALEEYKSATDKTTAALKVGDSSCAFAAEAETEAAKFLLLKGAVSYYVRGEAYDKAADCIAAMQSDICNLTPDAIAEIVGKATSRISESKAPRLIAYYRAAKLQIRARNEIPVLEKKLKRAKTEQLQRQYAEALAISGNWKAAYDAFAKSGNANLAQTAEAEAKGTAANEQAAELWWNYTPEFEGAGNFFKVHAVEFYQKALEKGEISGLKKTIVERRVAQISKETVASAVAKTSGAAHGVDAAADQSKTKTIDLGGGVKMEMIYVAPGSFMMGSDKEQESSPVHKVTLTKGFWLGKYEVTQKQWIQVMGSNPSRNKGDDLPVDTVSWEDSQKFVQKLNAKLGSDMARLPTEAEWEYACRAGTEGDFGGTGQLDDMGWYRGNSGGNTHPVGLKQANAWGFYDMHGNIWEWCNDWFANYSSEVATDPVGPLSGEKRVLRGGGKTSRFSHYCTSAHRLSSVPSDPDPYSILGFRLCMTAEGGASARSNIASNASGAISDSAIAKRGKSIMVKIKNGIELEFISCPAGTFTQGATKTIYPVGGRTYIPDRDGLTYRHEVVITRPFWMSKYPITVEQFGAFCAVDKAFENKNGKQGGAKMPVCLCIAAAEDYCNWLNRRFASALPKKCIFRLPTDAEWEYALFANSTDKEDPYVRFRDGERAALQEICGKNLIVPVGTVGKPNAWGLYDMLGNGCHYVLDTISSANFSSHDGCYGHISANLKCGYKESETDPLHWYVPKDNETKACHLMRGGCYSSRVKIQGPDVYYRMVECGDVNRDSNNLDRPRIWTFRVVIGPDLVAEKMAKNGKK